MEVFFMCKNDIIAQNVVRLRKEKKFSQEALAEACNLSARYIGDIERKKANITVDILEKLTIALKCTVEELIC
jgi:transcriptional regulator with XRE-family HTH domain